MVHHKFRKKIIYVKSQIDKINSNFAVCQYVSAYYVIIVLVNPMIKLHNFFFLIGVLS